MNSTEERYFTHVKAYWFVIDWIEKYCTHVKGDLAKKPIKVDTWFKWQIRTIYGRYDRVTHRRAIREAYLEIPKKNGKSLYLSALSAYHLTADGYFTETGEWIPELGPEVYCAASTKEQARIIFDTTAWMAKQNKQLSKRLRTMQYSIKVNDRPGFFKVLSSDAEGSEGINSSFNAIDELHAHTDDGKLYLALKGSGAARAQPLTIIITTAGSYDPLSMWWNRRQYAKKVIENWKYDPHYHAKIYSAGEYGEVPEEDYWKEETWKRANPNYGRSINKTYLESRARESKNDPAVLSTFLRYHLGIVTQSHTAWIDPKFISACNTGKWDDLGRVRTWVGMDLGATEDLTAVARLFHLGREMRKVKIHNEEGDEVEVEREEDIFGVQMDFFCTANKIDHVSNNVEHITYFLWGREGWIKIFGEYTTDYVAIRERVEEHIKNLNVRNITFDRFGAWETANELDRKYQGKGEGFLRPIDFNSRTASPPMKKLQYLVKNRLIEFYGNPVLEWMFKNVMVMVDSKENIFPNKKKAAGKIDGVVAIILALDGWLNDKYRDKGVEQKIYYI